MRRPGLALLLTTLLAATAGCGSSDDGRVTSAGSDPSDITADVTPTPSPTTEALTTTASASPTPAATPASTSPSGGAAIDDGTGQEDGGGGRPGSNAGAGDTASGGACSSANLQASLDLTTGGGAAGSVTGNLVLRNAGDAPCTLAGYPGVSFVDGAGHQLGAAASRSGTTAKTVTVRPGDSAFAALKLVDTLNYDAATCGRADASGLRVYPPGQTAALYVEHAAKACTKNVDVLSVGPMSTDG